LVVLCVALFCFVYLCGPKKIFATEIKEFNGVTQRGLLIASKRRSMVVKGMCVCFIAPKGRDSVVVKPNGHK
jgi:hypothetical protein